MLMYLKVYKSVNQCTICIRMKCMCECIRVYLSGYKDEVAPFCCHSTVKALCPVFTSSLLPKSEPSFNICIHSHFSQTCTFYHTIFFTFIFLRHISLPEPCNNICINCNFGFSASIQVLYFTISFFLFHSPSTHLSCVHIYSHIQLQFQGLKS